MKNGFSNIATARFRYTKRLKVYKCTAVMFSTKKRVEYPHYIMKKKISCNFHKKNCDLAL